MTSGRDADSEATSLSLLDRAKANEADAWSRIADLYGPVVYQWAIRAGLQRNDAADIVQEVFHSLATGLEKLRRTESSGTFRGWLWTITRNKIRDHFRRLGAVPNAAGGTEAHALFSQLPDTPPDESDAESVAATNASVTHRALEMIRAEFEDRTWRAFWRVTAEGRTPADVADELGMTVRAVYMAKYRVSKRVRCELSGLLDQGRG